MDWNSYHRVRVLVDASKQFTVLAVIDLIRSWLRVKMGICPLRPAELSTISSRVIYCALEVVAKTNVSLSCQTHVRHWCRCSYYDNRSELCLVQYFEVIPYLTGRDENIGRVLNFIQMCCKRTPRALGEPAPAREFGLIPMQCTKISQSDLQWCWKHVNTWKTHLQKCLWTSTLYAGWMAKVYFHCKLVPQKHSSRIKWSKW